MIQTSCFLVLNPNNSYSSCESLLDQVLKIHGGGFFVKENHFLANKIFVHKSRDEGEVLAEALKIMLCDDRQHDMQKAAAFIKRLATFSLCFGSAESMAGT